LHERSDLLGEFLNGRAGELLGRRYELCDTLLCLFGVELFFVVEELLAHRLVVVFALTPKGVFCRVVGHIPPFLLPFSASLYHPIAPDKLLAIDEGKMSLAVLEFRSFALLGY
jgi:hypothetical protein